MTKLKLNTCSETVLITLVSEDEIGKVIQNLKQKPSEGICGVPNLVVKICVVSVKKPLTDVCNAH